jgi:hypothetical protein
MPETALKSYTVTTPTQSLVVQAHTLTDAVELARTIAQRERATVKLESIAVRLWVPPTGFIRPVGVERIEVNQQ